MKKKKCDVCTNTCSFTKNNRQSVKKCYKNEDCKKNNGYVCVCTKGFYLNDKNKCVRLYQCYNQPKTTKKTTTTKRTTTTQKPTPTTGICPQNEYWRNCKTGCERTCYDDPRIKKVCDDRCDNPGCICKPRFVRDPLTDDCVRYADCGVTLTPWPTVTTPKCSENAHFDKCGTSCPLTCSNYFDPPKVCNSDCVVGCQCDKSFVLNEETGKCILAVECPRNTTSRPGTTPRCPKNMVYTKCKSTCEPRCGIPANVTRVCTKECVKEGCECQEPFALDESNNCVRRDECKKPSKGEYYIIHILRKTVTSMYTLIFRH
uniref:TIL domain-containing protein n=1 Tax=Strongyloides papillosus TaxID=174720 RepID=A0A0N5BJT7_STREA